MVSPYARLLHQANEGEDECYNHLSDAGKKAYQVYCDQQAHVEDVKDCDTFIRGFRLGARMILDVVGEYDSPMVQINELNTAE